VFPVAQSLGVLEHLYKKRRNYRIKQGDGDSFSLYADPGELYPLILLADPDPNFPKALKPVPASAAQTTAFSKNRMKMSFLTPWIRDPELIKSQDPGSGMNNPIIPRAQKQFFGLKYLNSLMRIRDTGIEKF
jgi:hypothetical protein